MGRKTRIKDMKSNKCINIPLGMAEEVFQKLGIDPKTGNLMDLKRAIFKLYGIAKPDTEHSSRKTLFEQRPNNAYGIKITDEEIKKFMELFNLSEEDYFQESIGGAYCKRYFERECASHQSSATFPIERTANTSITNTRGNRPCLST